MKKLLGLLLLALTLYTDGSAFGQSGATQRKLLVEEVTTNTTSAAFQIPSGVKSVYGAVTGTGAVTQTQALYGDVNNDAANGILLCTLTLSGTTRDQAACTPFQAAYLYYYIITTNTTGTGASGIVYAMY